MGDFDARLGQWMAEQREARQLSQDAVAIQLGRDQPFVSKIERGLRRISIEDLLRWAEAVGVPQATLCQRLADLRMEFAPSRSLAPDEVEAGGAGV